MLKYKSMTSIFEIQWIYRFSFNRRMKSANEHALNDFHLHKHNWTFVISTFRNNCTQNIDETMWLAIIKYKYFIECHFEQYQTSDSKKKEKIKHEISSFYYKIFKQFKLISILMTSWWYIKRRQRRDLSFRKQ